MALKNKTLGKRKASTSQSSSKKAKLSSGNGTKSSKKVKTNDKGKGKDHAYEKPFIPIPHNDSMTGSEISEEELEFFAENMNAVGGFLRHLDEKGIARSKREQERLHQLTKPERAPAREDDLPSVDSHSEDDESWSLGIEDEDDNISGYNTSSSTSSLQRTRRRIARAASDDEEKPYETMPRKHKKSWGSSEDEKGVSRLPIKLQDGKVVHSVHKVIPRRREEEETSDEELSLKEEQNVQFREDVATGARFGRPAVVDVISTKSRKARVQQAKEQIASICQDIVADPENSIGLLRRLHTFCLPHVFTPSHPDPVPNDVLVRRLAILSQLAVFKDIVPGYRIRPLTDKEKAEKVSQIVQRTRDFEQGLVSVYHAYLRVLEAELKAKSELAESALQCICRLLSDLTHFNFQVNLMTVVVARLSRKVWDESSELCMRTLTSVFRSDTIGQASLEIVRLLNRMIKERHFNVHPNVMFCLLDLRLKTELGGIRASQSRADKERLGETMSKGKAAARRAKGKSTPQPHVSKKALKKLKETKVIEDEMREANAEVDLEERVSVQTETLKLLFVLYFRILKSDKPTPLLPAALQGISRFAHLVNIDFFKDLLQVLRDHVSRSTYTIETKKNAEQEIEGSIPDVEYMHHRLHCIVTAFELLSGQGEALNLDLTDFINHLYALILPLSSMPGIEEPVAGTKVFHKKAATQGQRSDTPSDMLFRALNLVFFSRSPSAKSPPWRTAAFAKRLLTASLHFPATTAARTIDFVRSLFVKEPKLDALLSIEDRITNGVYRPDVDDPQLCNPFATNLWELQLLVERHADLEVRRLAEGLLQYSRDHN